MSAFRQHHIGVLVRDIESSSPHYVDALGYEFRTGIIHDPQQAALVRFFQLPGAVEYLELIAPDGPESHLHAALKGRPGIHHICNITPDLDASLERVQLSRAVILRPPLPAVAFRGLRVAWIMNRDALLMELVEEPANILEEQIRPAPFRSIE